jgi:sigma-B regulation protein RsbU (phosphoserine phosphatase)
MRGIVGPEGDMAREEYPVGRVCLARSGKAYGASLLRVATGFWLTREETMISDLSAEFLRKPDLMAVGVVDSAGRAKGIVSKVELFGLMGKPFGKEILSRRRVAEVTEETLSFDRHENLFKAAEAIRGTMDMSSVRYYLVTGVDGEFSGIFSSKDMLAYLSQITQQDIKLAGALQERLVRGDERIVGDRWAYAAFSHSAQGLGGDFHRCVDLGGGRAMVAVGDVSGKGVAASVITSLLWGIIRFFDFSLGLATLLTRINRALVDSFRLEKYVTAFFMVVDASAGTVEAADMGHGHAWYARERAIKRLVLPETNVPLGIDANLEPRIVRFRAKPGDFFLVHTDGIVEQENESEEELGELRVAYAAGKALKEGRDPLDALYALLVRHQGAMPRLDDVTCATFSLATTPSVLGES